MNKELIELLTNRACGIQTKTFDPICEELIKITMSDLNSSLLREEITIAISGHESLPGKHGRDCVDPITGKEKEVKPKCYTGKSTNGGGCFNDYTRKRFDKDKEDNLPIIHSLFVDGKLQYVIEFEFKEIAETLNQQINKICEQQKNRYVRSANWTYKHWITSPSLKFYYFNEQEISKNTKAMTKPFKKLLLERYYDNSK